MERTEDTALARPLLDDWASVNGVKIEWLHSWGDESQIRVTAFGYDNRHQSHHHTLKSPRE